VDIPLSVAMYRWVVSEQRWLSLSDVRHVAPELWRSLCRLRRVAERARRLAADPRHAPDQRTQMVHPHSHTAFAVSYLFIYLFCGRSTATITQYTATVKTDSQL
jgi:hypothetical protein